MGSACLTSSRAMLTLQVLTNHTLSNLSLRAGLEANFDQAVRKFSNILKIMFGGIFLKCGNIGTILNTAVARHFNPNLFLVISILQCIFFPLQFLSRGKDSLKGSNLMHKTISQEAGGLQWRLPALVRKDRAQQTAAAPGYQKADVAVSCLWICLQNSDLRDMLGVLVSIRSLSLDGAGMSSLETLRQMTQPGVMPKGSMTPLCLGENKDLGSQLWEHILAANITINLS